MYETKKINFVNNASHYRGSEVFLSKMGIGSQVFPSQDYKGSPMKRHLGP